MLSEQARQAIRRQAPDGVTRRARATLCRRCGAVVMRGLDAEVMAAAVSVDVAPLSQAGELVALLAGRRTYALTWVAGRGRYEIDTRFPDHIEFRPPGSAANGMNTDVVAAHVCHAAPLPTMNSNHHFHHSQSGRNTNSEEVPF